MARTGQQTTQATSGYDIRRIYLETRAEGRDYMDRVTESHLNDFALENSLEKLSEQRRFAHFAGFLTVKRHYGRALDTSEIVTDAGGDTGIDALAIIVNGLLVTDVDQIEELLEQNGYLEVSFIAVQAERSAGFDGAKIGTFAHGVLDFFSREPKMVRNERIGEAAAIMEAIYKRTGAFRGRPSLWLYYVTTGKWTEDKNLVGRRDAAVSDLKDTKMFDDVQMLMLGADEIHRLFTQTKNAIIRSFSFPNRVEIPKIPGVDLAFVGYIPAKDFVDIISDDAGDDILGSIFYDNVRDWQDYNPVNSEIRGTLTSDRKERFVLMNNGVTIIAKTIKHAASEFSIEDFQIVNGCQTSHVVFDQRDNLKGVAIPLRLLATKDEEVKKSIVRATNRQTELAAEQLYALTEFAMKLESYFATFEPPHILYYERRDGQYDRLAIEKQRIVTPQNAIKAFASMFLEEPHAAAKRYKSLRTRVGKDILAEAHKLEPYYVGAFAAYRLVQQYNSLKLASVYKSARYHLLLTVRLLLDPHPLAAMNSHEMARRCKVMMDALWRQDSVDGLFQEARVIIDEVSSKNLDRENIRTLETTQAILKRLAKGKVVGG